MKNHKIREKVIRFKPRINNKDLIYDIIVTYRDRRKKGISLDKIGVYSPVDRNKWLVFNSERLLYWLDKGVLVNKKVKKKITKCLSVLVNG